jgi:hypothetical protein
MGNILSSDEFLYEVDKDGLPVLPRPNQNRGFLSDVFFIQRVRDQPIQGCHIIIRNYLM